MEVDANKLLAPDLGWIKVNELCSRDVQRNEEEFVFRDLQATLLRSVSPRGIIDHAELCQYLEACHRVLVARLTEAASHYSKLQWLWYLRRLPLDVFKGRLRTTLPYDASLAETLSAAAGQDREWGPREGPQLYYEVNRSVMRRILRFAHGVRYLSGIHAYYRRAGKSQPFEFVAGEPLPRFDPAGDTEEAIQLYDQRAAEGESFTTMGRAGTPLTARSSREDLELSILLIHRIKESLAPAFIRDKDGEKVDVQVVAHFGPIFETLEGLKVLNDRLGGSLSGCWPPIAVALVYLLRLATDLVIYGDSSLSKVLQYGYVVSDDETFKRVTEDSHESLVKFVQMIFPGCTLPVGFQDAEEQIAIAGSLWPLKPGGIVRRDKGFTCIDLYAATGQLNSALEFPRLTGEVANIRSFHFEDVVQDALGRSPWKPNAALEKLRQRPLRLDGSVVTDIDAIGSHGRTLLLVSCKSLIASAEYDKGTYSAIRNIATTVVTAVSDWNEKISIFRNQRKGDNYDFGEFDKIIGLVCISTPMFVPIGIATQSVFAGLRAACSFEELNRWIQKDGVKSAIS